MILKIITKMEYFFMKEIKFMSMNKYNQIPYIEVSEI